MNKKLVASDTRYKYDNRFIIIDEDGKVYSKIGGAIDFYDTVDNEDGGYDVAIKFDDKASATDVAKLEMERHPELNLEVLPVKDAFSFLEESSKEVTALSSKVDYDIVKSVLYALEDGGYIEQIKPVWDNDIQGIVDVINKDVEVETSANNEIRVYMVKKDEAEDKDLMLECFDIVINNYKSETGASKEMALDVIAEEAEAQGNVFSLEEFLQQVNNESFVFNSDDYLIYIGEAIA